MKKTFITIINISRNNDKQGTYPVHVEVKMENHPKNSVTNSDLSKWKDNQLKNLMLYEINNGNSSGTTYRKYSCEVKYSVTDDRFVDKVIITRIN